MQTTNYLDLIDSGPEFGCQSELGGANYSNDCKALGRDEGRVLAAGRARSPADQGAMAGAARGSLGGLTLPSGRNATAVRVRSPVHAQLAVCLFANP
eukprot:15469321-Alexandrium_andersonii.AAC.1